MPGAAGKYPTPKTVATPEPAPAPAAPPTVSKPSIWQKIWQASVHAWRMATNTPNIGMPVSPGAMGVGAGISIGTAVYALPILAL